MTYPKIRRHTSVSIAAEVGRHTAHRCRRPARVAIDGKTLEDQTVAVRDRDTASQQRIGLDKVAGFLVGKIGG